ncbi:MAG: hypothetical protein AAF399_15555 [Bacteroidota bacterium]
MQKILRLFLAVLILGCFSSELLAQRARYKPQTHELSLNMGSAQVIPSEIKGFQDLGAGVTPSVLQVGGQILNGGRYTYHHSLSNGFRLGVLRRKATFYQGNEIEKTDWDIRLGYIRKKHYGPVQVFAGIDAQVTQQEQRYLSLAGTEIAQVQAEGLGIAPLVGFRYFFSPYLSISAEAEVYGLGILRRTGESEALQTNLLRRGEIGIQTHALLSFHFVKMKKRCTCPKVRR